MYVLRFDKNKIRKSSKPRAEYGEAYMEKKFSQCNKLLNNFTEMMGTPLKSPFAMCVKNTFTIMQK